MMPQARWVAALISLCLAGTATAATVSGQVVTSQGTGLTARVLLLNPETRKSVLLYSQADGRFETEAPEGTLLARASHGPEWTLAEAPVVPGEPLKLTLSRLVDMPARGYYGTDLHMHSTLSDGRQTPAEVAYICRGEGLHVAGLSDHHTVRQHTEWLAQQTPDFLPLRAEEISTALGHIVGVNLTDLVSTDTSQGPEDIRRIYREVRQQGGFTFVAHPNAPGMTYRTPDIQEYDALEILNGSLPPYGPFFDFIQGRKAWHAALSRGQRLTALGNSDCHDGLQTLNRRLLANPEEAGQIRKELAMLARLVDFEKVLAPWGWKGLTCGTYRTYLKLEACTPAGVAAAIRAGRGFVTNGPLVIATLGGQECGSEVQPAEEGQVELVAQVLANRPVERLEVLVSGQVALTVKEPFEQLQLDVPVRAGDWVTVEVYGPWPEFATTNAWYVR